MKISIQSLLIFSAISWHTTTGIKIETLKKCCSLGTNYANSGLECASFQTPIAGVSQEEESACLNSVDMCCKNQNRQKQCELGEKDAQTGASCAASANSEESSFRKDCCEACELGLQTSISGQSCQSELGLGSLMDLAFENCCKKETSTTNPSTTVSSTFASTSSELPPSSKFTKSLEKHNENNPPPPTLEALCEIPDLCAHICVPTDGTYVCACYEGFTLMADRISCKPSKRSPSGSHRCAVNNPCDHECTDTGVAIKCSCYEGYELASDKKTCKDVDECVLGIHECTSDEICVNTEGDYDCQSTESVDFDDKCPEGYKFDGERTVCDDINECEIGLVCPKPGSCINTIGSFECKELEVEAEEDNVPQCPPGFYFKESVQKCEDIDECINGKDDCNRDSQICLNTKGNYTCIDKTLTKTCPPGFKKNAYTQQCEDIDECMENSELCSEEEECINEPGGHNCLPKQAPVVTSSTTVQTEPPQPLSPPPPPPPSKPIACPTGYKFAYETKSCVDIDECAEDEQTCDSNQNCYNTIGSYICSCKNGFTKDYHTEACADINECQVGQHDCGEGQRCDNTVGSYLCSRTTGCGTGYTLNSATGLCEDDNECNLGSHNCNDLGPAFHCRNTLGSYRCERIKCIGDCFTRTRFVSSTTKLISPRVEPTQNYPVISGQLKKCLPGYRMNSEGICEDVNECDDDPCKKGEKCRNLNGKYQCIPYVQCSSGYELNPDGTACVDINECARATHKCKNSQICKNGPGYYICQCPPGHKLNYDNECQDKDECEFYRDRICSRNAQCINTIGSYKCKCKEGFQENGHTCEDIDECIESSKLCHQNCVNLWGSYRCSCERGYTLASDNRTCTDINECEKFRDKNLCVGMCRNTAGSYTCGCPEGYRLGADGRTCQDIDECQRSICRNSEDICFNTRGSYKCHTISCPPNYIKDPEHKSRCKRASNVCDIRDTNCIRMPGQYSYHFVTFVSNLPIPDEGRIDFFQMKGPNWQSSVANFNMNVALVRCPRNIKHADETYFRMKRDTNKVVVSLVKPIQGPQEIELQLQMELYVTGIFQGKVVSTVFVYVSEYEF